MTATILPFVTPAEMALPARRGYSIVSDELHARLRAAEANVAALRDAHSKWRPAPGAACVGGKHIEELETAESELDAAWRAIDAHEAEGRDADAEAEFERLHGEGR